MLNVITEAVLQEVELDRKNEPVDLDQLREIVQIYSFLSNERI